MDRAEQPALKKNLRLERRPKKSCQKKTHWGKMTGNLDRNRGPSSKQLAALPTGLYSTKNVRYKKLNFKPKILNFGVGQINGWFRALDDHHVLYSTLYTATSLPMMLGPCRISCRQNSYFGLIRKLIRQK